jgi:hypothetical protein
MHAAALMQLLSGYLYTALVAATAELGIAEALAAGPLDAAELAGRCGADADAMRRLCRGLAALGLLLPQDGGRWAATPALGLLRADAEGSLRALALLGREPAIHAAWLRAAEAVRTGKAGFELAHGQRLFDFLDGDGRLRALFQGSLVGPPAWNQAIVKALDLAGRRRVVDVGAGDGRLVEAVLDAWPACEGIAFDRPGVATRAPSPSPSVDGRLTWVAGDFFQSVPAGGDVYLLRWVLHDWGDDEAVAILGACRAAMAEGGVVLVVENLLGTGPGDAAASLLDLSMLVLTGGRERTEAEYAALFARAGLRPRRCLPTAAGLSVLEAEAAS